MLRNLEVLTAVSMSIGLELDLVVAFTFFLDLDGGVLLVLYSTDARLVLVLVLLDSFRKARAAAGVGG